MPRAERSRDAKIAADIIDAALTCFERFGLKRATMDDVAAAAGVTRKTVYNYFENKTELIGEVIEAAARRTFAQAATAIDYTLAPDQLVAAAEARALEVVTGSPYGKLFLDPEYFGLSLDVADRDNRVAITISEYWQPVLDHLEHHRALRQDVTRAQLMSWIMAAHLMLVARAHTFAGDPDTLTETLRLFLAPAVLAPVG